MPRRGYRKGLSDTKEPRPHVIKSRASTAAYRALHAEADARGITFSSLVASILDAHVTGQRLEVPQRRGMVDSALRELARLGNNLNQIAHHANMMKLHLLQADARACIALINDVARQLVRSAA